MSMNAMQKAVPVQWRCQSCGDAKSSAGECSGCGATPSRRDRSRNRLIAPVSSMETFGNDQVQNNVVHIYGDVDCDNDYTPPPSYSYTPPQEARSELTRGLYAACTAAIWVSAIAVGLVTAFFVVIFIKAFIIHGL